MSEPGQPPSNEAALPGRRRGLLVTLLVATAFIMDQLDGTILANAAPSIAAAFGVPPTRIAEAITAYLITLAVLIPLSGWVADRFGARRVFCCAVAIFTIASGLCAASQSLEMLIGMRVLQAAGGALMVPVGRLVVLRAAPKSDLIRAIAYLTWPALVAPVVAPVLAGYFSTYLSWRWIFLVNLPIGVVVFAWAALVMPAERLATPHRLDVWGVLLSVACFGSLTYLAAIVSRERIPPTLAAVTLVVAVGSGVVGVRHLLRTPGPLLNLRVLRVRTFRLTHAGGSVFRSAVLGLPFLLPLMFQVGFGWSPVKAGAVVLFVFVGNIAIKPASTTLLRRFGFRSVLVTAITVMVLGIAGCALLTATTPLAVVALLLAVGGASRSMGFTAYNTIAFSDIPAREMPAANTLASTVQQLALGFGVAASSLAIRVGEAGADSATAPYRIALLLLAAATAFSVIEAWRLPHDAGTNIGGGSRRRRSARLPGRAEA
jgi:EmrB/QacA subfamily drug resistance transporter